MKLVLSNMHGGREEYETDALGQVRAFDCVEFETIEELMKFLEDNNEHVATIYTQSILFPKYPELCVGEDPDDYRG